MSKRAKILTAIFSIFCFAIGAAVGGLANLIYTSPESYEIPAKIAAVSEVVEGEIDAEVISDKKFSIHFLELGNKYTGDCTLVKVGDTEMLIDSGSKESSIPTIKNYLDKYVEDDKLEYVVVTHAHQDHYAGFASSNEDGSIFDFYEIGTIIEFAQTYKSSESGIHKRYEEQKAAAVSEYGTTVFDALECYNYEEVGGKQAERKFELGEDTGVFCEILYHKFYEEANKDEAHSENNFSVCLQIVDGDNKYLFTGDLEAEGESSLVDSNEAVLTGNYKVYKAGHHGSKTSSSDKLMQVIKPEIVTVCCCAGSDEYTSKNENQFPTQEFINNVYEANPTAKIYVTTLCVDYKANSFKSFNGNIVIAIAVGETTPEVYCANNGTDLKDTDWFKANRTLPQAA